MNLVTALDQAQQAYNDAQAAIEIEMSDYEYLINGDETDWQAYLDRLEETETRLGLDTIELAKARKQAANDLLEWAKTDALNIAFLSEKADVMKAFEIAERNVVAYRKVMAAARKLYISKHS